MLVRELAQQFFYSICAAFPWDHGSAQRTPFLVDNSCRPGKELRREAVSAIGVEVTVILQFAARARILEILRPLKRSDPLVFH